MKKDIEVTGTLEDVLSKQISRTPPALKRLLRRHDNNLLVALQIVHDHYNPNNWRDELLKVAYRFQLSTRWMPNESKTTSTTSKRSRNKSAKE